MAILCLAAEWLNFASGSIPRFNDISGGNISSPFSYFPKSYDDLLFDRNFGESMESYISGLSPPNSPIEP